MDEKVSVIIPTYNRFLLVQNAIKSALKQTYKNLEVIVINDNSSDLSYNNFDWDSLNVKYVKTKECGVCSARNLGISKSSGSMLAFLDDDDSWLPGKIEKQILSLDDNKMSCTEGFYGASSPVYNPNIRNLKYFGEKHSGYVRKCLGVDKIPDVIKLENMIHHNIMVTSSVLVGKEIAEKCGGFYMSDEYKCEDWPLWLRCLKHTDCSFVDEPLFYYNNTRHERNALKRGLK